MHVKPKTVIMSELCGQGRHHLLCLRRKDVGCSCDSGLSVVGFLTEFERVEPALVLGRRHNRLKPNLRFVSLDAALVSGP